MSNDPLTGRKLFVINILVLDLRFQRLRTVRKLFAFSLLTMSSAS